MCRHKWDFRDVSAGIRILREFLLGRKHHLHGRFPPLMAPRTIPPPDIPRGPEYKYSKQYYYERNALHSVLPPVVAPIAEGQHKNVTKKSQPGDMKADSIAFNGAPTPGLPWGWDGHCYYEYKPDPCPPSPPCTESQPSKCAPPPCSSGDKKK